MVSVEPPPHRWVEIQAADGKVITVIELLSHSNKTPRGREEFEGKLQDLLQSGINTVEIDLVRGGQSVREVRDGEWPSEPNQIVVTRARRPDMAEVYPCPLRQPLPAMRVPLRSHEPDAALDLQPLIDRCHLKGRYWMLPYHQPLDPPLSPDDHQWATDRLAAANQESP